MPLLVLFHGSGQDGTSLVKRWRKLAEKDGILLAGPDAADRAGWAMPTDGPEFVGDIVANLESRFPVDPTRVYLFGHSAGAMFVLKMAALESQFFAAAVVHAGAFRTPSEKSILLHASRKIPVLLLVGTKDPFFSLTAVRDTKQALQDRGFPVELVEILGHDHDYAPVSDEINRMAWQFLSTRHLDTERRYKKYVFHLVAE